MCDVAYFFFSILSPNYVFSHKFPLKLLANGVICNTWYSSCSKPPPVYPGLLLAPPAAKSCLQDTTRSAKSQPDSLHSCCRISGWSSTTAMRGIGRPPFCLESKAPGKPGKRLCHAPLLIIYKYIIVGGVKPCKRILQKTGRCRESGCDLALRVVSCKQLLAAGGARRRPG